MEILEELKNLNLTQEDFDLLLDGLKHLPSKDLAGDIMGGLFDAMLAKNEESAEQRLIKRERDMRRKEDSKKQLIEDIDILKSKIILLKRYLISNDALKQVNQILDK